MTKRTVSILFLVLMLSFFGVIPVVKANTSVDAAPVFLQEITDTPTATATATNTATATATATATGTATNTPTSTVPAPVVRPLIVMSSYSAGSDSIAAGDNFTLTMRFTNSGLATASNIIVTFESAHILPKSTGGVQVISALAPGAAANVSQPMLALSDLAGNASTVAVNVSYSNPDGEAFTESFTVTLGVRQTATPQWSGVAAATATPTAGARAQLVVGAYTTDVDPLQPGTDFNLNLEIRNLGNSDAKAVTLVLGGSGGGVDTSNGTPVPGGTQGGSSDVTNFAPLGSSNLYYLGDISAGALVNGAMHLIVNVNTQPGAYPLKLSFVYTDSKNNQKVDDQVITMLVYSLPNIEVGFYRDPGQLFLGQPNALPLQVINLGRKPVVLGNMKVTAQGAAIENGVSLVGNLESGGYFTLDSLVFPENPGPLDLTVVIGYTDDFNTPREIQQTISVNVEDMPVMEPGMGEGMEGFPMEPVMQPETLWQKVVRFFKGLLGLGSGVEQPEQQFMPGEMMPGETGPEMAPPMPGTGKPLG